MTNAHATARWTRRIVGWKEHLPAGGMLLTSFPLTNPLEHVTCRGSPYHDLIYVSALAKLSSSCPSNSLQFVHKACGDEQSEGGGGNHMIPQQNAPAAVSENYPDSVQVLLLHVFLHLLRIRPCSLLLRCCPLEIRRFALPSPASSHLTASSCPCCRIT